MQTQTEKTNTQKEEKVVPRLSLPLKVVGQGRTQAKKQTRAQTPNKTHKQLITSNIKQKQQEY